MASLFDHQTFRAQFPLFLQPENKNLVYLDNAATTQRPAVVIEALSEFYLHSNANTHRSSHRLARAATEMLEQTRAASADFLGAATPSEIIFCRGATEGLNLLAHGLTSTLKPGDEILLSRAEHHANLVPWQMLAERHQLKLRFLPSDIIPGQNGVPQEHLIGSHLSKRTKILAVTGGSNALGFRVNIREISQQLRGADCLLVVDGAQLAAHDPVDVQALGCDFFVCSAHKFYGPTGVGLLYGRRQLLEALPPWQGGGEMIRRVTLECSEWAGVPQRFEAGTASLASIAGLAAAIKFLSSFDRLAMQAHEQALCLYLHERLGELDGIQLLSKGKNNLGVAAFVASNGVSAVDLGHGLDAQDIAVRVGHHCAQPLIDSLGKGATLRASVAAYNSFGDIDRLFDAIQSTLDAASGFVTSKEALAPGKMLENTVDDLSSLSLSVLTDLRDWQSRYRQLLKWGALIANKPDIRIAANEIGACEAATWLCWEKREGKIYFLVDSDSRVVRGLAALLLVLINGKTAHQICELDLEGVFQALGLNQHLSPSRTNGFYALVSRALESAEPKV